MKLDIILPVVNKANEYTRPLLKMLVENTVKPNRILLIDNGSTDNTREVVLEFFNDLPIEHCYNPRNMGVNWSWNYGIQDSEDADLCCILNNDIVIPPWFIEETIKTFEKRSRAGIVVPRTVDSIDDVHRARPPEMDRISYLGTGVAGWAFTIRRQIAIVAGSIPKTLMTFYGDNWLFEASRKQGFNNLRMDLVPIFHYVSRTLYDTGMHETCPTDAAAWEKIKTPEAQALHWDQVPMHLDMSPYAGWYQEQLRLAIANVVFPRVIEIGTRYGCSARILLEELVGNNRPYILILIDAFRTMEAAAIVDGTTVKFWQGMGQNFAHKFEDGSVDLLHIDVDPHDGLQELELFELYSRKLTPQGRIIFHDATDAFKIKDTLERFVRSTGQWEIEYCDPAPLSPASAPAAVYRRR